MNQLLQKSLLSLHANCIGNTKNMTINNVSIDSRSLEHNKATLFFAIKGDNHDAHNHIHDLILKGVRYFVVSYVPKSVENKATFFVVKNTLIALQEFAAFYRQHFHFPLIGVTGSNGKTIVKEWLSFLLNPDFSVAKNPKSYNSQVGVPLSVLGIHQENNIGVFEAGISKVGEMKQLETILKPTIGILTNIGSAHDEGFPDLASKTKEKLLLIKDSKVLIYKKSNLIDALLLGEKSNQIHLSWSFEDSCATLFVYKTEKRDLNTILYFRYKSKEHQITIPFQEFASIENCVSCLCLLLYLNYKLETIQDRFSMLYPVEMRLKLKTGIQNTLLIDDSYSSDFQSLKIALDFLESQKQYQKKTVILSDIFQSGLIEEVLYNKVYQLIVSNKINRFIGIGTTISKFQHQFKNAVFYKTTDDFLAHLNDLNFSNETLLIKGARRFHFEKIVQVLEEKNHETVLEINLNAISHNLNYYKSKINSKTKMMAMVKAFGYGNGGFEIAKLLEHHKIDYLGVAFADEGIALKTAGIKTPIMVLNPETTSFNAIIQYGLEPEIYSLKGLHAFIKVANQKQLENYPIHIKLDTGMHRLGFLSTDLEALIKTLQLNKAVLVKSILSHMATTGGDVEHELFALEQINIFEKMSSKIMHDLQIKPIRHILKSSGIGYFKNAEYDMVRLGIGLYGISENDETQNKLEIVGTLKSIISQIRTIQAGESVGYERKFIAKKTTTIATVPIGYADGISRQWGNGKGFVMINNQKANILGSICMDMLMVDISGINAFEGDAVTLFGKEPTVTYMASVLNTIPYEILTSISQRVKRVFYRD
jgi:Alr-MurF fusion protein